MAILGRTTLFNLIWNLLDDSATVEARLLRQLLKESPELPDWSAAVQPVLTRLLTSNNIAKPMMSRVLTLPVVNALALPHATIVLAESLVEFCRDERDQLAFVLAHEAAHIHLGHSRERQRASTLASVLRINPLLGMGLRFLVDRAFSREQEFEADKIAVHLCARAGYAPQAGPAFLRRLGAFAASSSGAEQLLSTHPPLPERISQLTLAIGG